MRAAAVVLMRELTPDEVATACALRHQGHPWQYVADKLGCSVQRVRDAVWQAESLGFQMACDNLAWTCGRERVAAFLRQCADALEARA